MVKLTLRLEWLERLEQVTKGQIYQPYLSTDSRAGTIIVEVDFKNKTLNFNRSVMAAAMRRCTLGIWSGWWRSKLKLALESLQVRHARPFKLLPVEYEPDNDNVGGCWLHLLIYPQWVLFRSKSDSNSAIIYFYKRKNLIAVSRRTFKKIHFEI